jgi:hypothetical protein
MPHNWQLSTNIISGILIGVAFLLWILQAMMGSEESQLYALSFTYVSGIFEHDRQPTGPKSGFRAVRNEVSQTARYCGDDILQRTLPSLGIIPRAYPTDATEQSGGEKTQWERLESYIHHLNEQADDTQYKLLFVARHGQDVHNVKEKVVGRQAWEVCKFATQPFYRKLTCHNRATGPTWTAMMCSLGQMPA